MVDPTELEFVDDAEEWYSPEELAALKARALAETESGESPDTAAPAGADAAPELAPTQPEPDPAVTLDLAPWLAPPPAHSVPRLQAGGRRRGRKLAKPDADRRRQLTPEQRLLILDAWQRSSLPAKDFAALVGLSRHTLYAWKKKFAERGPQGLVDQPRGGPRGSRLPELTKRAILMIKQAQPDAGLQRISDLLARGPALPASPNAVARVLKEAGYTFHEEVTTPHRDRPRRFERARPNQLWQTDLFSFTLKRQNRRVYLVAFLDDHSRYLTAWNLGGSQSTSLVLDALRNGLANYPPPEECLTDNGSQYVTWRGTSQFQKELRKRGIRHVLAKPRHPQTLGKTERFWGTLWRECLEAAVFVDLDDARIRIGHFIDHYNFRRTHRGIGGLVPADRYFGTGDAMRRAIEARVAENALDLARHGRPKEPFYLAGRTPTGDPFSVHTEGDRLVMLDAQGQRHELDPNAPLPVEAAPALPAPASDAPVEVGPDHRPADLAPGQSELDEPLRQLAEAFGAEPPRAPAPDADTPDPASAADAPEEVTDAP